MTEEQKQHKSDADTFAATLGGLEGKTEPLDRWEERSEAQHKSAMETNDAIRRRHEHDIVADDINLDRAARYEEQHRIEWAQSAERHAVYLAEVKHVQAHRVREVAAFERIAHALEKLTSKGNP